MLKRPGGWHGFEQIIKLQRWIIFNVRLSGPFLFRTTAPSTIGAKRPFVVSDLVKS
jgi:hypothetical protein